MRATKTIQAKSGRYQPFEVFDTGIRVRLYDYDTNRTYERNLWNDRAFQPYVMLNGAWRSLSQMVRHKGVPFTCCDYVEV